jgi:L-threonylcarbamoyladenylate synthase
VQAEIEKASEVIRNGGVILYPTDTIWGLGCDPANEVAVEKIFRIKQRSDNASLIVLVSTEQLLNQYVDLIPEICYDLMDMATSPLTIIYPKGQKVAPKVLADDGSIAVRMTKHEFCSRLMQKTRCGLVSTSANISGQPSPLRFEDISPLVLKAVDYVVNLPGAGAAGKPSQIIKVGPKGEIKIIRR